MRTIGILGLMTATLTACGHSDTDQRKMPTLVRVAAATPAEAGA